VAFLGLIDSPAVRTTDPVFRDRVGAMLAARGTGLEEAAALLLTVDALLPPEVKAEVTTLAATGDVVGMTAILRRTKVIPADLEDSVLRRLLGVRIGMYEALYTYRPQPSPIAATLFRSENPIDSDPSLGWDLIALGGMRTVPIGGDHLSIMMPPYIDRLTEALVEALRKSDGGKSND
jgi:thioesterase domain-containing protein